MKILLLSCMLTLLGFSNALTPDAVNPVENDLKVVEIVTTTINNTHTVIENTDFIVKIDAHSCSISDPQGNCSGAGNSCQAAWDEFRDCHCGERPDCDLPNECPVC